MIRANLRAITNDAWENTLNKKYVNAQIERRLAEIEDRRKEALAEYAGLPEDDWYRAYAIRTTNENYDRICAEAVDSIINQWHNDQSYYFIYKDGSCVAITAEEILRGAKRPLLTGIAYACLLSADDHYDTETGDLDFYTDERMEACDWNYDAEDERKWQYETAIEFKFGTEWSKKHPEFAPAA